MPYDEPDETDPMMLVGVELPADPDAMRETAMVIAEEFSRMGFGEEKLMDLFRNPFYGGAHRAYVALGEEKVAELVREHVGFWGAVRFQERDSDPGTGMTLLPVLESREVNRRA